MVFPSALILELLHHELVVQAANLTSTLGYTGLNVIPAASAPRNVMMTVTSNGDRHELSFQPAS